MYVGWFSVYNLFVFSAVGYLLTMVGCMCFMFLIYAGICVDVCGVVCVVECSLFLASGCCLLCCHVVYCSRCVGKWFLSYL